MLLDCVWMRHPWIMARKHHEHPVTACCGDLGREPCPMSMGSSKIPKAGVLRSLIWTLRDLLKPTTQNSQQNNHYSLRYHSSEKRPRNARPVFTDSQLQRLLIYLYNLTHSRCICPPEKSKSTSIIEHLPRHISKKHILVQQSCINHDRICQ